MKRLAKNLTIITALCGPMFLIAGSASAEYRPSDDRCGPQVTCYAACVHGKTSGFADERVKDPAREEYKHAAKKANAICGPQCSHEPDGRGDEVRQACAASSYQALLRGDITIVD